ncbi:204_t:CDS:2, partial [Funneliformis mosseae]
DYLNNPNIYAQYITRRKVFHSKYKILALEHYSQNVKYVKNGQSAIQYQIPNEYIIKTEVANQMLYCETKYTLANKVLYTITWKEGRAKWIVSSKQSATGVVNAFLKKINRENSQISGIHIFGFNIEILHQARIKQSKKSSTAKAIVNKRKRPLNEMQLVS